MSELCISDLLGKAVAKVDGLPISSVHTGQAWLHVSPQHSDDEAEEITLPQSSAGETSDDDSRDPYAKRRKMSATPDPGRLGKVNCSIFLNSMLTFYAEAEAKHCQHDVNNQNIPSALI